MINWINGLFDKWIGGKMLLRPSPKSPEMELHDEMFDHIFFEF
jgi:hypothetical protein